jgi:energy-converting hydrogenase Eha subunit C
MSSILTFIHDSLSLIAIGTGARVLFGLLAGELSDKWAVRFLESSVLASVTGLPFSTYHLLPMDKVSMLSIYVSGAVVLAWRKYHLAGVWCSIFAFATTVVLCLNVLVTTTQVFRFITTSQVLASAQAGPVLLATQFFVVALFTVLGVLAVKKFHNDPVHSGLPGDLYHR